MPAQLVSLDSGPSILLDKPILLLGRHPECDIQIDSRKISRRHCCIAQVSDYLVVRDLGSTNGIRINGLRVNEGRLTAGDELTLGNSRYKVSWDAMPPAAVVAPPRRPTVAVPPPAPPPVVAGIEDEILESCDEPVPLDEPGGPPSPPLAQTPAAAEESLVLPENLELLPNSDVLKLSPHQSGQHPPA